MSKRDKPKPNENYYDLLELDRKCSKTDINNSYKRMAVLWHPDKNKNKEEAGKMFQAVSKAYQVLSDDVLRSNYDKFGIEDTRTTYNIDNIDNIIDPYEMFKGMFET